MKLINPNAANLDQYELRLQKAIDLYNRYVTLCPKEVLERACRPKQDSDESVPKLIVIFKVWIVYVFQPILLRGTIFRAS